MPFQAVLPDNIDDESYPNSEENQHTSAFLARGVFVIFPISAKEHSLPFFVHCRENLSLR